MGSLMNVQCCGFVCRLCSKSHREVIFIYGTDGIALDLLRKINNYLPVEITPTDPLPKTICVACTSKILQHHLLMEQIQNVQHRFKQMRDEELIRIRKSKDTTQSSSYGAPRSIVKTKSSTSTQTPAPEPSVKRQRQQTGVAPSSGSNSCASWTYDEGAGPSRPRAGDSGPMQSSDFVFKEPLPVKTAGTPEPGPSDH
ncbi:uncharacterized protein LOC128271864 [Anopheles cruzii]|uniref:uncharacterized protein LOC128271864 n=1 Tax=Anopheles cruzii TaxID=68878 RepID=UPI0022EC4FF8|nr:uncharacterized protein LOC128271864 [Anopheles cruzii]